MTVLIFIMWFSQPIEGAGATSFTKDFHDPRACNDARDGIIQQLGKQKVVFVVECYPKGEIRT